MFNFSSVHRSIGPSVHRSIGPSVHRSIGPSVHRFIGLSAHRLTTHSLKGQPLICFREMKQISGEQIRVDSFRRPGCLDAWMPARLISQTLEKITISPRSKRALYKSCRRGTARVPSARHGHKNARRPKTWSFTNAMSLKTFHPLNAATAMKMRARGTAIKMRGPSRHIT
jgi:hypothetical protein